MPELLIVAATQAEIAPFLERCGLGQPGVEGLFNLDRNRQAQVLITGVGMVNTAFAMGRYATHNYTLIINAGICGAFNRQMHIGQTVSVTEDRLSEMGAESGNDFIPYNDLGLGGTNIYNNRCIHNYGFLKGLAPAKGITVNKVHGHDDSISKATALFGADVESMEGAAFFRACNGNGSNYLQLRTISNYVEKRDKSKWNIPLAVTNLNNMLLQVAQELNLDIH